MSRAFSKIPILVIIIVLFAGGIFAWQYFGEPKEKVSEKVVEVETADWNVYRNEEYGFELKYPQDWKNWKTKERSLMSNLGHRDFVWIQSNVVEFSVDIWDFSFYSYDQLTEPPPGGIDPDTIEKKEIIIDDQPATELSYVVVGNGGSGTKRIREVFIQKNQLLYKIKSIDSKKCDQILSTFKFIELEEVKKELPKVPISCKDSLDCPKQMKCENSVCVNVGCIEEGGISPSAGINPEWLGHLPTECCEGLKSIAYSRNFDKNCNFMPLPGAPTGVCSKCGNGICEAWETKCNCPDDCLKKARDVQRITDLMATLRRGALEFYYDQHGSYPVLSDTSEDGEFLKVLVDEGYLAEMLLDPLHPKYFYEYEGARDSYTLKSYCEIEGGDCDMVDGVKDHVLIYSSP